jgi:hypothetical protein
MMETNYIYLSNEKEVEDFMVKVGFFNDSLLKETHYESGSFRDHKTNSIKITDDLAQLTLIFESQIGKGEVIVLVFEHIERFNLVPSPIDYDSLFGNPVFFFKDGFIFFSQYEEYTNKLESSSPNNTWVKAKTAKYRILN